MYNQNFLAFKKAIQNRQMIKITFVSKHREQLTKYCIPLDFKLGKKRHHHKTFEYLVQCSGHLARPYIIRLNPEQVIHIQVLEAQFDSKRLAISNNFSEWNIARDWT